MLWLTQHLHVIAAAMPFLFLLFLLLLLLLLLYNQLQLHSSQFRQMCQRLKVERVPEQHLLQPFRVGPALTVWFLAQTMPWHFHPLN